MIGGASVWLFYTVFGFFILPLLVHAVAVKQWAKQLDRSVTIRKVRLNPYTLSATMQGVLVKDKDGEPLVSWNEAYLNFQLASLFHRAWIFKELRLSQPFVRVQLNKNHTLTFSDLVAKLWKPDVSKGRALRIDRLRLIGARAAFTDLTPRVPFQRTIGPFEMTLTHFRTDSDNKIPYALSGITDGGERITSRGFFYLDPIRSQGEFSLEGICLAQYAPLYQDAVRFAIKDGVINLHSTYRYEWSATTRLLSITNATFEAQSLKLAEKKSGQSVLDVSRCLVSDAGVDFVARRAEAEALVITGGRLVLRRNKDSSLNVIELAKPAEAAPNTPGGIILLLRAMTNVVAMLLNTTNLSTGAIRNLHVTDCAVHLEDLVNAQAVRLDLEDIAVHAKNVSNRAGSNVTAEVRMRWQTNGTVRAEIQAGLSPAQAEVKLALDKLDLRPLAAYLEPYLEIFVLGSKLGLAGTVRWSNTQAELTEAHFHGDAWLDEFSTAAGIETESLLRWNVLRISGLDATLNPPVVSAAEARLEDVSARLTIETNRTINLLSALRRGGTNAPAPHPPHPPTTAAAAVARPKVTIGSLVLSNATVHFTDRSLRPNVNIILERLNGTFSGLSSDGPERAVVDLRGTVDETAQATVTGRVTPWNLKQPTDLKIALREMSLLPEDPYSRKYLGYQLQQGMLSLDSSYHLAEQKLKMQNRVTLDRLVLGEKVDSPEATKLPVRLAIAILQDRNGRIELDVPVEGSLADPDFQLGKVISGAIGNVLNKIVASPFSALSALFGRKGEALSFCEFEPGSTNLLAGSIEKLDVLVNGLYERPELQLEIEGSADSATDLQVLRREALKDQNHPLTWKSKAVPSENPVTRRSLSAFADEKGGAALMRMGTADLLETVESPPAELRTLAAERAQNVQAYILQTGKVPAARISIKKPATDTPANGSRVYFRLQ